MRVDELTGELTTLRAAETKEVESAVQKEELKYYELHSRAKHDLARKDDITKGLQVRVQQLSTELEAAARLAAKKADGTATARELKWLRGAVRKAVERVWADNAELRRRLPRPTPDRAWAVLSHGTNDDGRLDAFEINQGGNIDGGAGASAMQQRPLSATAAAPGARPVSRTAPASGGG
jgi:hypothetical protein